MKTYLLHMASACLLLFSCAGNTANEDTKSLLTGKWRLASATQNPKSGNQLDLSHEPSTVILHLQQNGYFQIYDSLTDSKLVQASVPRIQQRSKGQWKLHATHLLLTHYREDSTYMESLEIKRINENELVTRSNGNHSDVYKTYGK